MQMKMETYPYKKGIINLILSPCLVNIFDGDKIPLSYFLNVDKIGNFKIILYPAIENIFEGDKIPIVLFFE